MKLADLKTGDRVSHDGMGDGTVTKFDDRGAHVVFDRKSVRGKTMTGIYDDRWFAQVGRLRRI